MKIKDNIPNFITLLNLLSGCIAIIIIFDGPLYIAPFFVGLAAIFDFADGFAARLLNAKSKIGKELDSLCDLVSFGVVPGLIVYKLLLETGTNYTYLPYIGLIIPIFSALRLANFNIDTRQSDSFIGLPVPANAILFCSIPLILHYQPDKIGAYIVNDAITLSIATILFSSLLVSNIPLFSLKLKGFSVKHNIEQYIYIICCIILLIIFSWSGLPLTIILYIIASIINNYIKQRNATPDSNHQV